MATNTQNLSFPSFVFSKKTMEKYLSDVRNGALDFIKKYSELERTHILTASVGWATCCPRVLMDFQAA